MKQRIIFIFLGITIVSLLPFQLIAASFDLNSLQRKTSQAESVPNQLKPPSEDMARLEDPDEDDAETKPYHIPMVLNDSVENHIEYFKTRGREVFQRWLDRSGRYIDLMKDIFREKNLPEDLVYVAMIESGFNPYAVSWAKAVGPWQFMPATGKLYGLKIDWWIDERKDPYKSTQAAAEHLKDLHNLFGSWPLALASYNAGAGKVQRAVLRTRSEDFWDLKASRYIRKETKNYVPKYMAATIIAKNPLAYGFTLPALEPFAFDEVEIGESTDLRLIARCAGCTYEEIKELNPEIKRWITPPHYDRYRLRLPVGTREAFLVNYAAVPEDEKIRWERHQVRQGETVTGLAKQYNTTPEAIRDINGLKSSRIQPGRHVLIPRDVLGKPGESEYLSRAEGGRQQQILYRVRSGETLSKIARQHNVTVAEIKEWNKGIGNMIRAGQKIKLVVDVDQI